MSIAPSNNFLRDYIRLHEGTEVPAIFALWCGIAGISCALGRRVYLDMSHFWIYPNFYIVLVAESGRNRKSTSIMQVDTLVRGLDPPPNMISQKCTPEALISAIKAKDCEGTKVLLDCVGYVIVDELSNFLNRKSYDSGLAPLLNAFFDCDKNFEYHTIGRGVETVQNTCLGLLGGSTIEWLRDGIPEDAIGGGLTSRIIFVHCSKPAAPVAIPKRTDEHKMLLEALKRALNEIYKLQGAFRLTPEAEKSFTELYNDWYYNAPFWDNKLLAGYASRRSIHLLKLAIVFSASESTEMLVHTRHIDGALASLQFVEQSLPELLVRVATNEIGQNNEMVMSYLRQRGTVTRAELLRHVSHRISSNDLSMILDGLVASGLVNTEVRGRTLIYTHVSTDPIAKSNPSTSNIR